MNKRAMLWIVGLVGFGFTFLAATNVKQYSTSYYGTVSTSCDEGLSSVGEWFKSHCSESLPPRLGVMALGLIILVVCGYFAEKGAPRRPPRLEGGHRLRVVGSGGYVCEEPGCDFRSPGRDAARAHRIATGAVASEPTSQPTPGPAHYSGFGSPEPAIPAKAQSTPEQVISDLKTCPDCAEEVRAAARKCRFCGYLFAPVAAEA
jgi:Uncharacterised protein family UPF0547